MSADTPVSERIERKVRHGNHENDLGVANQVVNEICGWVQHEGIPEERIGTIAIVLTEALVNAVRHGNILVVDGVRQTETDPDDGHVREVGDPQKQFRVAALLASMRGALFLIVEIENEFHAPFDPTQVPDPTEDETVERPNGRGVFWMRSFASHVEWNKGENGEYKGNRVRLMFHHPSGGNVEQLEDACSVLDTLIGNARWLLDVVIDELKNDGSQPTSAEDVLTSPAWS